MGIVYLDKRKYNKKRFNLEPFFINGGGAGYCPLVLFAVPYTDYTFILLVLNRQIIGSYFNIVTNNCVEFTFTKVVL